MPDGSIRFLENDSVRTSQPKPILAVPKCGDISGVLDFRQAGNGENDRMLPQGQHPVVRSKPNITTGIRETIPSDGRMNVANFPCFRIDQKNTVVGSRNQLTIFVFAEGFDDRHGNSVDNLFRRWIVSQQGCRCTQPQTIIIYQDTGDDTDLIAFQRCYVTMIGGVVSRQSSFHSQIDVCVHFGESKHIMP